MSPAPFFRSRARGSRGPRRRAVSELYASMLMLGVTISLGSVATGLITNQFGLSTTAAGVGAALEENSSGIQVSFIYATVASSSRCPVYGGAPEGGVLLLTVFDYGRTNFTPVVISVNDTLYYSSAFPTLEPGGMATYRLTLAPPGTCAHTWGQTVLMANSVGDNFQLET